MALARAQTQRGRLHKWWANKYQNGVTLPFDERTEGDLLREYYEDAAYELERLKDQVRADGHNPDIEVKMGDLESLFSDSERDLQGLDAAESQENWTIARKTGDPLADKWENAIARGETPDLDEEP